MMKTLQKALFSGLLLMGMSAQAWAEGEKLPSVDKLTLPRELRAGYVQAGYVSLDAPAGEDGEMVYFAHDGDGDIQMPDRLYIEPGATWGRFAIRTDHHISRRAVVEVAAATKEGGVADKTQVMPAPLQSYTLMQRGVTTRFVAY